MPECVFFSCHAVRSKTLSSYYEWAPPRPRRTTAARWRKASSRRCRRARWPRSSSPSSPWPWTPLPRCWPWRTATYWPPLRRVASSCESWSARCGRCAPGTLSRWERAARRSPAWSRSRTLSVPTALWTAPSSRTLQGRPPPERRWRSAGGCRWKIRTRLRTPERSSAPCHAGTSPWGCRWLDICLWSSPLSCMLKQTSRPLGGTSLHDTKHPDPRICPWCPTWVADKLGRMWPPDRRRTGGKRRRASWRAASAASAAPTKPRCSGSLPRWRWWREELFPTEPSAHPAAHPRTERSPKWCYSCLLWTKPCFHPQKPQREAEHCYTTTPGESSLRADILGMGKKRMWENFEVSNKCWERPLRRNWSRGRGGFISPHVCRRRSSLTPAHTQSILTVPSTWKCHESALLYMHWNKRVITSVFSIKSRTFL